MKLKELLEHLPPKKWVKASPKDIEEYKQVIFDLIKQSYAPIGGHHDFKSPSDIKLVNNQYFEIEDVSGDDEPDVVSVAKKTPSGTKFVAGATDGTKEAKREYIRQRIEKLKRHGYYIEVSGRIADILLSAGVNVVDDEQLVRKVLKGKDIEWLGNGWYKRKLGGKMHKKILLGYPK